MGKRNRRAAEDEVTLQRQEEDGESVVENAGADTVDYGAQNQYPPSVKYRASPA
ncbi:MAG: hypothetical protein MZV70_12655 [Desulfobacterales bacterium]|nr:hypothetical protein [Desulfobacterales bacterium]